MTKVRDQLDVQIGKQQVVRDQAEQSWRESEQVQQGWPALRAEVHDNVLPAVRLWRKQLMPYTNQRPRRRFVGRIKRLRRRVGRIPWFHIYAIRLRLRILELWFALNWNLIVQISSFVLLIICIIWVLTNIEQITIFLQDLLGGA